MAKRLLCFVVLAALCLIGSTELMAQVSSSGQLVGTVTDQTGAVIAGAIVKIKDTATGTVFETKSSADGHFSASSLRPGVYTVTVSLQGFKGAEFRDVKITVGQVYDLDAKLEVGALESTVVVEAGAEVLETVSTTIGTSITGKQITQLPLASRDALDLAILMPGASTTGRARQTSFMGLPKGAINITLDGINAQDNLLKSNDGFFTLIRPRIDAMEEFSISTAGQGAEQSGEGAVQIRFETKRGGNVYHGAGWWYHRNDFFNANYYFNNEKPPGVKETPRARQRLNQFGGSVGGPIWKEKIFFFVAMDNYRNPGQTQSRTRTILSTNSLAGKYDYIPSSIPASPPAWITCVTASSRNPSGGALCTANLLAYAATVGLPSVPDAAAMTILNAVETARTATGVSLNAVSVPWTDSISFNNPGNATRRFPDLRLDYNITKNIQWTGIYHYNYFIATPDFLNGADSTYPVAPFNKNQGSQVSNRNEWVTAVRWNIAANKSNEVRAGLVTSPVSFFPDLDLSLYPNASTNLGTVHIRRSFQSISQPVQGYGTQGRNGGVFQLIDTFSWSRGKHNIMIGGDWTRVRLIGYFASRAVNTATLGLGTSDPANALINNALVNASSTQQGQARNLYANLSGRVNSYSGTTSVQEATRTFQAGKAIMERTNQHEFGFYGNDSWRVHPKLTVNFGLRYELQFAPTDPKNISYRPVGGYAGVFGVSGLNHLFNNGTTTPPAGITTFELNGNRKWYNNDLNNFAPNVGLSWTPGFSNKLLKTVFGESGKTVFRVSYTTTYTREGINNFQSIAFSNPGLDGSITTTATAPSGNTCNTVPANTPPFTAPNSFPAGCLTLTGLLAGQLQSLITTPPAFPDTTPFQMTAQSGQSVNMFEPNLRTPLVHNWSFGIQREISPSIVVEVRYVGNHGSGLWRQDNINEINIFENGFLAEFANARNNLAICRANAACATTARFSNQGLAGQVAVPILTQLFTGSTAGSQTNGNFAAGTTSATGVFSPSQFGTWLVNGAAGSLATGLANNTTFLCNLVGLGGAPLQGASLVNPCSTVTTTPAGATGFAANFFVPNPHANVLASNGNGGAFRINNNTHSTYNGVTVEVRKRYSKGMQFSGNYTFAKALTNYYGDSSGSFAGFTTLRNPGYDKGPSPWDLRHTFKFNMIYSFPFGPGRKWTSSHAWLNRITEGWEMSAVNRWQSGRVFRLISGNQDPPNGNFNDFMTVNGADPGVMLVGITPKQLQSSLSIRKLSTGNVYFFPAALISSTGTSNTSFIAPCTTPGRLCQRVFLFGPSFFRADINVVKKIKIYERFELEYRAEFLNAFNNINFFYPGSETTSVPTANISASTFGQVTNAYRDVSTTDDNGGRIIQMVLRLRF
jgi:hypothetical protein